MFCLDRVNSIAMNGKNNRKEKDEADNVKPVDVKQNGKNQQGHDRKRENS